MLSLVEREWLDDWRVLGEKSRGSGAYARAPQNQNDYEIGYARPTSTTPSRAMAGCGKYAVTVQTILRFPDHLLRATAQRVVVFDEDLCSIATDLLDTLRAASAIGITATHIGVLKRLAVIELPAADGVRTYVNPQIVWASADMIRHEEGSVSMPGVTEEIERHARVRMSYQDLSGVEKIVEADGLLSVCLQHEVDQLDGIFWIYRLSRLKRDRVVKRFDKTQRTQASVD
jgi:peptide deformylase